MTQWQPIATAPKDGAEVLICSHGIHIAKWYEKANFGHSEEYRPGWQIWDCDDDPWYSVATDEATHWMPLPPPPPEVK